MLTEGRVLDAESAGEEIVRELWTGILGSVAARMGGTAAAASGAFPTHPCSLKLGEAAVRMALDVEEKQTVGKAAEADRSQETIAAVAPGRAEERTSVPAGRFDLLLEVELEAVVRFGSRSLELRDLLEMGPGDVVELDRQISDPVDLIIGDKIVARGEVVLVDGNFGLRVTEVAEPVRRLESI